MHEPPHWSEKVVEVWGPELIPQYVLLKDAKIHARAHHP